MCPAAQGDADPPCLPLRGRWQREALAEGEIPHGFLSPSRLRRQPPPRGGLAARHCRADGTSRTPPPTFVIRQARLSLRRGRCPHRPAEGNRIPAAGHAGPALQGVCVRADRVVRPYAGTSGTPSPTKARPEVKQGRQPCGCLPQLVKKVRTDFFDKLRQNRKIKNSILFCDFGRCGG